MADFLIYFFKLIAANFGSAVIAIIIGMIFYIISRFAIKRQNKHYRVVRVSSGERIQRAIDKLSIASKDVDDTIREVKTDLLTRGNALAELQTKYQELTNEEKILIKRIEKLKDVPIEVAEYFQEINNQTHEAMEERNTQRDIKIFILGILVTTLITIILKLAGLA